MGTFELINAGVSLLMGVVATIWSNSQKDRQRQQEWLMERYTAGEKSVQTAREHKAQWKGFYWVRAGLAGLAACYFFLVPLIAVLISDNVQIVIGYYDTIQGFWPWSSSWESVTWIKVGSASPDTTLVYDPVRNNVMISIINLYMGNQFARRS